MLLYVCVCEKKKSKVRAQIHKHAHAQATNKEHVVKLSGLILHTGTQSQLMRFLSSSLIIFFISLFFLLFCLLLVLLLVVAVTFDSIVSCCVRSFLLLLFIAVSLCACANSVVRYPYCCVCVCVRLLLFCSISALFIDTHQTHRGSFICCSGFFFIFALFYFILSTSAEKTHVCLSG